MSEKRSFGKDIATGLLVATLAGCTPEAPQQPTQESAIPTAGLVEPTATIAPTETPAQYLDRMTQEVAPTLDPIFAEKINNGEEVTIVDVISGDNLTLAEQGDDSKTSVTEQVGYISKLQVDTGHNVFTGEPVTNTEQLDTDSYIGDLLSKFAGDENIIISTAVTTDTNGNALVELYVIDASKPQDPPSRVVLTQEGDKYAVALQTTWPDGSAVVVMLGKNNEFTQPTKVAVGIGAGEIKVITPTPTTENGKTSTENKQMAEILGEKEVSVLSIPGKGNLGKIDLVTGGNAEGERGKVLGFEIPADWDKSIGDPETLNQQTIANMLYERWKLQRPDSTMTQDEFTKQLLSGELTDTVVTYPVNDGNGGIKQEPIDIKNGVVLGFTDYDTFQTNREANDENTLHVPVTNNSTGFSIVIKESRFHMLMADRSTNLRKGTISSFDETYRVLETLTLFNIAAGQPTFDNFATTLQDPKDVLRRWEDVTKNADIIKKSDKTLAPLYQNYSTEWPTIAIHLKMEVPHVKDGK